MEVLQNSAHETLLPVSDPPKTTPISEEMMNNSTEAESDNVADSMPTCNGHVVNPEADFECDNVSADSGVVTDRETETKPEESRIVSLTSSSFENKPIRPPPPVLLTLREEISQLESTNKALESRILLSESERKIKEDQLQSRIQFLLLQNTSHKESLTSHQNEIRLWKERIEVNDKAARKAIETRSQESQAKIDQLNKKLLDIQSEKDSMVVKYAQGETKITQLSSTITRLESQVKERDREKTVLQDKIKNIKIEQEKATAVIVANKSSEEIESLKREVEKHKDEINTLTVRTKWAQNKLTAEKNAHKECKTSLEQTQRRFKETKEECETVRVNCQKMIETYQKSEEIESNKLGIELQHKTAELTEHTRRIESLTQDVESARKENTTVTNQLQLLTKQHAAAEQKISDLESSIESYKTQLTESQQMIMSLREENRDVREMLNELNSLKHDLETKSTECEQLALQISSQETAWQEHLVDMENFKLREAETLELTQKMTFRNAELQSESSSLRTRLSKLEIKLENTEQEFNRQVSDLQTKYDNKQQDEMRLKSDLEKIRLELTQTRQDRDSIKTQNDASLLEISTIKKKQVSSHKELKREVNTLKRQLEMYESKHTEQLDNKSPTSSKHHSRTNSTTSLDKLEQTRPINRVEPTLEQPTPPLQEVMSPEYDSLEPTFLEPDKQKLIEKIVSLQRKNARKNEKLDFCEDQIKSLIEEIQKKNKIIQNYALREESGLLSSNHMDQHKSQMSRKRGIMASISSQHAQDGAMSLELQLQINHKLQAVLEDTLLKNITLKESMETLGQEIAKIADENIRLKERIGTS